ncbi:lysozyme inhibitor LprI family protein [Burkholderia contaminans]|uniref:lysozyme inhibitor LprI family protein n=1 Tax=Burkholderia contaminans TaxID=488447 RepID=UPI001CF3CC03|nr:lysozyme inhibitor LprI family protein [Burkholderia contaminans]MCA7917737.1 lysozyme inhibitor LprI family protein [Burkholderia contaminans]UUX41475.1 lysozyme inhibitor LprI family protein [Burkholderia contaminans]
MFGFRLSLTLAAIGLSLSAHADSIDCSRAKTRTERLICSDKALVSADSALASAYYGAIDMAADQQAVVRSQRAWLAQRDACADAACIATAYRDRQAALKQVKHAGWETYRDPALGISFEYLGNRQIKKPCPEIGGERCVAVVGRNMTNSSYFIAFEIVDGALEPVAEKKAGFERQDDGKWMSTYGRGTPQEVERFSGAGWRGMRATITCGISDPETGFHAAGGECYWAVLSNGKRAAVANTQGIVGTDDATLHSVTTFRFDR